METKNLDTKYCVGLGEILFDVLPTGSQLGGAPANFAYHAGQHGLHSVAVSAVGKDVLGETALRLLDEKKLKYVMPEVEFPTGDRKSTRLNSSHGKLSRMPSSA